MANSILEIIARNAEEFPERLCVVDESGEYTYSRLWKAIKRTALCLQELGVQKEQCVLVECTQNANYFICDFACNLIGAYFVPLEHNAAVDRVEAIQRETDAVLLICQGAYAGVSRTVSFESVISENGKEISEWSMPNTEDIAEILYTTGTTGTSKGISVTYRNNIALAENICDGTKMQEGNVELIPLPLSHSHGIRCAYANFFNKGTVVLTDGVTKVLDIYRMIKRYEITAIDLSPTAATVLLKLTRGRFGEFNEQLDYIQIGTAALSEELKEALCKQFPSVRLYNFYGSTESGRSCALNFNSDDDRKYCIGYPTRNAKFIITDDERNEIHSDENHTGLIACAGPMNMKGYWKQPELTASIMKNGFIYTNDEGYIDERGYVYVLGRKDDIINYKGIKIAPEEIEEIVLQYKEIKDCACVPVPDKNAGQIPKVYLAVKDESTFNKTEFMRFLEEKIDGNKVPKQMEIINEIPRAFNGKIQRKKLTTLSQQ